MTTSPRPLISGDFHVRADGLWIYNSLTEAAAWGGFLAECRAGRFVELLRGKVLVAYSGKGLFR